MIMKMNFGRLFLLGTMALAVTACSEDDSAKPYNPNDNVGKNIGNFTSAEWYPGGEKGTTSNEEGCYSNPSPEIEEAGLSQTFKRGETFFEHNYTYFTRPYAGLGPAYVRSGCEYCHPSYGHGKRQNKYNADQMGNGYLLVIYHPTAGTDPDGVQYAANSYIRQVTGMPQTKAMYPFKAPVDERGIHMQWKTLSGTMPSIP